jgi:hypothetical protein
MLIVPVKRDRITTTDGKELVVVSYTSFKLKPAVYAVNSEKEVAIVFFSEIEQIQNTKVELQKTNVFKVLGTVKRLFHLPQPKDIVKIEKEDVVVSKITLGDDNEGLVFTAEDTTFDISDITDIEYTEGGRFNKLKFMVYYKDYLPLNSVSKIHASREAEAT